MPVLETAEIKLAEQSMQFKDSPDQIRHDCRIIFSRGDHIIFGTEAGHGGRVRPILMEVAQNNGYKIHCRGDSWVAVHQSIIKGTFTVHDVFVMDSEDGFGHHSPRYVTGVKFDSIWGVKIAAASGHYLTRGRKPGEVNYRLNLLYTVKLSEWEKMFAGDADIVLYGGDQNIVDKFNDTFLGQPWTSVQDTLKRWEPTGHGNIDVIALLDRCKDRLQWLSVRVLDDSELRLFSDHFHVEARARIIPKVADKVIKPPSPPFIPAHEANYTEGGNFPLKWIVIHSTVSPACYVGAAEDLGNFWKNNVTKSSAHYGVDPENTRQYVGDHDIAYHCGFNEGSLGIEMCDKPGPVPNAPRGSAAWKAAKRSWRWVRPNQWKMLNRTARLTARNCLSRGIPIQFVGVKGLKAGKHGITTHANMSKAFKRSTHWDPGFWPRRAFMVMVRAHARKLRKQAASG